MIERDALLRMVKAARIAKKLSDDIRFIAQGENKADQIYGILADAIYIISGENQIPEDDFSESRTYRWLFLSTMSDEYVTDEIMKMAKANEPTQPKPNLISRVQFLDMVRRFGGYPDLNSTPEGEWPK